MRVFEPVGIFCPESFFGFGIGGVETLPAVFRAEIVGTFVITGRQLDFAGIDGLATDGVHGGFRG
jgi:hypothetical protein